MAICIVQLSDIHFSEKSNSLAAKLPQLAAAITSADPTCLDYLLILSGDIAYQGIETEYRTATNLLGTLTTTIIGNLPKATVKYLAVPGNHDCILPEDQVALRAALVDGIKSSLQARSPDAGIITALVNVQQPFFRFSESLGGIGMNAAQPLCSSSSVALGGHQIQVNLYNTALLSKRRERQGELAVPMELIRERISLSSDCALSLSVFHHSYPWLETNNGVAFRNHIESISDIAFCGH